MQEDSKRTALRMIPYGLYVLTAESSEGAISAATINWVTQTSFSPPLVALGVRTDSGGFAIIKEVGVFALNLLGKGQEKVAFTFFKHQVREGDTIGGEPFEKSPDGAPLLVRAPAWVECKLVESIECGDHALFVGEVTNAGVRKALEGRPDDATLWLRDLGPSIFYGG